MQGHLARIGVIVFAMLFATALVTEQQAGRAFAATASVADGPAAIPAVFVIDGPAALTGSQAVPEQPAEAVAATAPEPEPVSIAPVIAAPIIAAPAAPVGVANADGMVLASWYGPGFYGNRTACGQTYTPQILGVAHKTLPCGTLLTLTYGSRVLVVPVIDRGPYVAGRTLDLSNATKLALGCTDLCTLRMQVGH